MNALVVSGEFLSINKQRERERRNAISLLISVRSINIDFFLLCLFFANPSINLLRCRTPKSSRMNFFTRSNTIRKLFPCKWQTPFYPIKHMENEGWICRLSFFSLLWKKMIREKKRWQDSYVSFFRTWRKWVFSVFWKKKCWEINIENILLDRSLLFFHVQIMIWRLLLLLSSAYIVSDLLNTSVPLLIMLMRWWRWESDYFPLPSLMCGKKLFSPECYWRKRRERERRRIRSYSYANDYNRVSKWQTMLCLWIEIDMNKVILHRTDELLIEDFAFSIL